MKIYSLKVKYLIFAAALLALLLIACLALPRAAQVFNVNGREIPIYSVERGDNKIAVTFDCAWNDDDIDEILAALDEYDCKATFFVLGTWAEKYPESLKKIYEHGHEIGNHSYNHADYTKMSSSEILSDLDKCDAAVESVTGEKPCLMRAPSGGYNNTVVKAADGSGRVYIQWSVDGIDYGSASADEIYRRCTENTDNGDIILLHNGTENTASILPEILRTLKNEFEFVPVSELIYRENYIIDHTGRQFSK